jgi:beta-glucanase (GH16 family)
MKCRAHVAVLFLTGFLAAGILEAQEPAGWDLAWADEFAQADGSAPDPTKWGYDTGGSGWGNNELQYYTNRRENSRIEDGKLVIEARAENFGGRAYTSARLLTKGKAAWTHGRIEARIQIPKGQGIWPAFWMLGTNIDAVNWPNCGEIDIMENIGSFPSTVHGTVHGPGYSGASGIGGSYVLPGALLGDGFRTYAVEWSEERIRWFLDGQPYFTLTPAQLPAGSPWVFNSPHFLLLNIAVGGNWPGNPDATTAFPQRMRVDYVRVYRAEPPANQGANLLTDPDLEAGGLPQWTRFGPNIFSESTWVHRGAASVKAFGSFNGTSNDSGIHQDIPAVEGESYGAEGWMFTPVGDALAGGNTAWIEISFRDAVGQTLALHRSPLLASSSQAGVWTKYAVDTRLDPVTGAVMGASGGLIAPAGTATLRKRLVMRQPASAAGSAWFDALSVWKIPMSTPAETRVTVDPLEQWLGYINVFELPQNGGAYLYGSNHATADLRAVFNGPVLQLYPNSMNDPSPYWYIGGGAPGNPGNKRVEALMYVEKTGTLSGRNVTFSGRVASNTLTAAHAGTAFIRDFAPDYSSFRTVTAPLEEGSFNLNLDTDPGAGRHVQYGFQIAGPNVWITDAGAFGAVRVTTADTTTFTHWIAGFDFPGMADPDLTPAGDPDADGKNNLMEYALDENPAKSSAPGKQRAHIQSVGGMPVLSLTLPVRSGAVFDGYPAKSASLNGLSYRITGSNDLTTYDREVVEVNTDASGLPALSHGWTYRSFSLAVPASVPAGFLRLQVSPEP